MKTTLVRDLLGLTHVAATTYQYEADTLCGKRVGARWFVASALAQDAWTLAEHNEPGCRRCLGCTEKS